MGRSFNKWFIVKEKTSLLRVSSRQKIALCSRVVYACCLGYNSWKLPPSFGIVSPEGCATGCVWRCTTWLLKFIQIPTAIYSIASKSGRHSEIRKSVKVSGLEWTWSPLLAWDFGNLDRTFLAWRVYFILSNNHPRHNNVHYNIHERRRVVIALTSFNM